MQEVDAEISNVSLLLHSSVSQTRTNPRILETLLLGFLPPEQRPVEDEEE